MCGLKLEFVSLGCFGLEIRPALARVVVVAVPNRKPPFLAASKVGEIEKQVRAFAPDGGIAESSRKSTLRVLRSGTGSLPKPIVFSFGGFGSGLAEQVARDVDQGEPSSFFWQFVGVGFDEYFDGFVAGMNFDTQCAALEIDFVTPSRFTANNCVGHLRSYERLKG